MATWRVVKSLLRLRDQLDAQCPGRSKASDGTVGDAAHQADPTSDHNLHVYPQLGPTPVVCAFDATHDPGRGADMGVVSERIRLSRDPRVAYVIFNRRIFSATNTPWTWRPYSGASAHTEHMHVSTVHTGLADDTRDWQIGATMALDEQALADLEWREDAFAAMSEDIRGGRYKGNPDPTLGKHLGVVALKKIAEDAHAAATRPLVEPAPVDIPALVAALRPLLEAAAEAGAAAALARVRFVLDAPPV